MSGQLDVANLAELAAAVDAGADRLRELMWKFDGYVDDEGAYHAGVRTLFEEAVAEEADKILDLYETDPDRGRAPGEETRRARAVRTVKKRDPQLYGDYYGLKGRIEAGQRWIANKRAAISALQTLNKTGAQLAGVG